MCEGRKGVHCILRSGIKLREDQAEIRVGSEHESRCMDIRSRTELIEEEEVVGFVCEAES